VLSLDSNITEKSMVQVISIREEELIRTFENLGFDRDEQKLLFSLIIELGKIEEKNRSKYKELVTRIVSLKKNPDFLTQETPLIYIKIFTIFSSLVPGLYSNLKSAPTIVSTTEDFEKFFQDFKLALSILKEANS
jgi:hypothetical protein